MKIAVLLLGVHLAAAQYGPLPSKKGTSGPPDSANEIVPPEDPRDHGLNGLAPGVAPHDKPSDYWWSGPNSPFRPGAAAGPSQGGGVDQGPAAGCPPGGCGAPPPCTGSGCPPTPPPGSNPFGNQGYGPRPGSAPSGGAPPVGGIPPRPSSQTTGKPIDISSNPFLSSALQKPIPSSPNACSSQDTYCVPPQNCFNGLITDTTPDLALRYKKGPCQGNYVCCRANPQAGVAPSAQQPSTQYPAVQPVSQQSGANRPGSQLPSNPLGPQSPGNRPGSQYPGNGPGSRPQLGSHISGTSPGSHYPSNQPSSQFPGNQPVAQPGSHFPSNQPGSQFPGNQPGTQPGSHFPGYQPGAQPGSQFPGNQPGTQPGTQFPGNQPGIQPGSQFPGNQHGTQPGSQFPGNQPGNQPGSQYPGNQPGQSGSSYPSNRPQPGSQFPTNQPGSYFPGNKPGSSYPNNQQQPDSNLSGNQPGSQFLGNQPGGTNFPSNQQQSGYGNRPQAGSQLSPGSQYPTTGSQIPGSQPGSQFPGNQPGSQTAGVRPYVTDSSVNKYTGPLNTTPPPGCAAALKCVAEVYCTAEGVMSNTPVQLTREQLANKVPLADCQDPDSGLIGKCCRDPNYKDPWPAGMMMTKGQGAFDDGLYKGDTQNFDDGQYRPEHQGEPTAAQPGYQQQQPTSFPGRTIKKPLGVFNTAVTPFPTLVKPQPGQTHSQVFPQNEDRVANQGPGQPGINNGQYSPGVPQQPGQPDFPSVQPGTSYGQGIYSGQPGLPSIVQPDQPGFPNPQGNYALQPGASQANPPFNVQPGKSSPQSSGQIAPNFQQGANDGQPQSGFPAQTQPANFQQPGPSGYGPPSAQKPFPPPLPGSAPSTPFQTSPQQGGSQVIPGQECGVRRPPFTTNSDTNTANSEFPWQAIILSSSNKSALCSGAIISDNAVITSAHCLEGFEAKDIQVKVGSWKLNEPGKTQISNVAAIVNHPSYDSGSLAKDQAVLALEQPLVPDHNVDKVCLPPADNRYTQNGRACFITGYGRPNLQGGLPGTILHKIEVELLSSNQCEATLKQTYLGKYFILNDGFTCAVPKNGGDFCLVDIGSPLVCDKGSGRYEVAGIYSWDTQCSSQAPAVLTETDSRWSQQVVNTPVSSLKEQQQNRPKLESSRPEDIDQKPGFALGYGK